MTFLRKRGFVCVNQSSAQIQAGPVLASVALSSPSPAHLVSPPPQPLSTVLQPHTSCKFKASQKPFSWTVLFSQPSWPFVTLPQSGFPVRLPQCWSPLLGPHSHPAPSLDAQWLPSPSFALTVLQVSTDQAALSITVSPFMEKGCSYLVNKQVNDPNNPIF